MVEELTREYLERKRVLIVEDQEVIRQIVWKMLKDIGFGNIVEVGDGSQAMREVLATKPDLIICDIAMEPVDGFKFVEALQARGFKDKDRIPTIFLTGHTEREMVIKAKQLGADGFLVKPVSAKDLKARITFALSRPE
ncbi:MAG: response regulator [Alphaproteobacteria bacterium]|nr:response regulator [Alphaproteobacteria bacterium]